MKKIYVYAAEGSEFYERKKLNLLIYIYYLAPPTSKQVSKYGLTCKFGKFGRTPAVLVNATVVYCLTPTYTDNVRKINLFDMKPSRIKYTDKQRNSNWH